MFLMVDVADENICDNRLLFYSTVVRLVSVSIRTEFSGSRAAAKRGLICAAYGFIWFIW
jgi:hypothetical protein